MTKTLRDLLDKLENKNKDLKAAIDNKETTTEELNNLTEDINLLEAKIKAQKKQDELDSSLKIKDGAKVTVKDKELPYNSDLFIKGIANSLLRQRGQNGLNLTFEQQNKLSESTGPEGGFAVPQDIRTEIYRLLTDRPEIHNLVSLEPVMTRQGARTYETRQAYTPLQNLAEYAPINAVDNPNLQRITWNLKDFAGLMTIPNDLLKFANKELERWLIDWLVDKVRVTRNNKILYGNGTTQNDVQGILTSNSYKDIELVNPVFVDFKKVKNIDLLNVFKHTAAWVVNQDGFNLLDSLVNEIGDTWLKEDVKDPNRYTFLGLPVHELLNVTMPTSDTGIPMLLGDFREGYRFYYDDAYEFATTDTGAGTFETNTTKARVITRMDGGPVDIDAIIKINISNGSSSGK